MLAQFSCLKIPGTLVYWFLNSSMEKERICYIQPYLSSKHGLAWWQMESGIKRRIIVTIFSTSFFSFSSLHPSVLIETLCSGNKDEVHFTYLKSSIINHSILPWNQWRSVDTSAGESLHLPSSLSSYKMNHLPDFLF